MHQIADLIPAPVGPIHIKDMGAVPKRTVQFPDHTLYMVERKAAVEIIILGDKDHIRFGQLLIRFPGTGSVGVQHRTVVARPLRQRTGIAALDLDVVDTAVGVVGGDVQPDRPAPEIFQRVLGVHMGDHQAVIVQDGADQEFGAGLVLKHQAHESIVHQTKLLDLGQKLPVALVKRSWVHRHHVLSMLPSFLLYSEVMSESS